MTSGDSCRHEGTASKSGKQVDTSGDNIRRQEKAARKLGDSYRHQGTYVHTRRQLQTFRGSCKNYESTEAEAANFRILLKIAGYSCRHQKTAEDMR